MRNLNDSQYIGVDISAETIQAFRFNGLGEILVHRVVDIPTPSMPGAVTVVLCEMIQTIDPNNQANIVGIALSCDIDYERRVVIRSIDYPGWIKVPLAEWLEIRLQRKVVLGDKADCILCGRTWQSECSFSNDMSLLAMGAARLAVEKLTSFLSGQNKG